MKNVTIIGAGVIGLCTAYYLQKSGVHVRVIDRFKQSSEDNCSFGNAGMVVPSHFVPLAAPGAISKGLKWMLNASSPFYIKPRLDIDLIKWMWKFYRHSSEAHVEKSAALLHNINKLSKELYAELAKQPEFDFGFQEKGLMMLFKTDQCAKEEIELAQRANRMGIEAIELNRQQVNELQQTELDVKGGVLFPGDAHLNPKRFMHEMRVYLEQNGVHFLDDAIVQDFITEGNRIIAIKAGKMKFRAENIVLSAGTWSAEIAKKLHLNIPLQAGKGYSFTLNPGSENLKIPSIFCEEKVAVTPLGNEIRFAGTMEIGGLSLQKNQKRIQGIKDAVGNYMPNFDKESLKTVKSWVGLRPCSPDGLPYIGRGNWSNLVVATGHAMMGMSLGPATGKLVAEILLEESKSLDIDLFSPLRFNSSKK